MFHKLNFHSNLPSQEYATDKKLNTFIVVTFSSKHESMRSFTPKSLRQITQRGEARQIKPVLQEITGERAVILLPLIIITIFVKT